MAIVEVRFLSECLKREVTFTAVLPMDEMIDGKFIYPKGPFKTLYLLHGLYGSQQNWLHGSGAEDLAAKHQMAIIMPNGENKWYVDNERSLEYWSSYIGQELVAYTRSLFPLSERREDTFIAGLSMGGYGAIVNGLRFHDVFGAIGGFSSALVMDKVIALSSDDSDTAYIDRRSYWESVWGDLAQVRGSLKDYLHLADQLDVKSFPHLFLACGEQDDLLEVNRMFRDKLEAKGVDVEYDERTGGHDWIYWEQIFPVFMTWIATF